ncbi:MAG TPA: DUF1549 and DUF1553 domain-containing protein [Thermoguttaceae bacterium]|nr:DUF1549 and DUF1553 domain-containing protein [Thermoguttaceae bacterium]
MAKATVADANLARLEGNTLYPVADGRTTLAIEHAGQSVTIPVTVKDAQARPPVSFKRDVMPVFSRAGCNVGACHGAARGKDGFRLSLFGYDPEGDYFRLTREVGFRRLNIALPEESLIMEKATGKVPHTGGKRFEPGSEYYQTLLEWLQAGAPNDPAEVAKVEAVELYPPQAVLEGSGVPQRFIARAKYSDGTDRDVTHLAAFLSNNDNSAPVDPNGLVTAGSRGQAFVLARFESKTVGSRVLVLPAGLEYAPPDDPPVNYIDELVAAKLRKLRILPSGIGSDPVFLRRVTIDVTGRLPMEEEYRAFLADRDPGKRAKLIDRLLGRKEFAEIWALKWVELLMIKSRNDVSYKSAYLYSTWLTEQIAAGVPVNQMARELLSANGGTFTNPATNFYRIERDTLKTAENVAQVFMGFRTQCAQCHNHPFDRWTMHDYYSFAAFFSQIGRKPGEDHRETIVFNRGGGDVRHPVDNRVMPPDFLGGPQPDLQGKDRREVLAQWLTSSENPYFAANVANRIWAHFFGIGIVEPVDDVRVSNPPGNPELLKALGAKLVEYDYDFKRLVRDVCNSKTYQRATERNESNQSDERNFAAGRIRRMQAEMLLDCISQVTETQDKFRGLPPGARAVQIADGATTTYFLTTFGRSSRDSVAVHEVKTDPTLSQSLHLLNGDTVNQKIQSGGAVKRLLDAGTSPADVVKKIYVRSLSREPTQEEIQKLLKLVEDRGNPQQTLEDVFWALLNSREFLFNH